MHPRSLPTALAGAALLLALTSCSSDDDQKSSSDTESSAAPASPDGTYRSDVGTNDEQVTFEVEDGAITHLQGKAYGDCGGTTVTESIDGEVDIPVVDGAVAYDNEANGVRTTLTGTFDEGTFDGTFSYVRATASCPTQPYSFTATVG